MSGKIIFLILVLLIFSPFTAAGEVYLVFADREFGFWAVRSYNISHSINYTNKTLNINTGDSVEWMNMDNEGDRITILSDNILWEGGKTLGGIRDKFSFTFNSSGTYGFHIVENTRLRLNASNYSENRTKTLTYEDSEGELHTITVNRGDLNYRTGNYLTDVISTEWYNYQRMTIQVTGPTIGNGTHPVQQTSTIGNGARPVQQSTSPLTTAIRRTIKVNARPTPASSKSLTQTVGEKVAGAAIPEPLESYQEFTIYAILKRWIDIIMGG